MRNGIKYSGHDIHGDAAKTRLKTNTARKCRRNANRTAHICSFCKWHTSCGNSNRRPARRPPTGFAGIKRVSCMAIKGDLVKLEWANSGVVVRATIMAPASNNRWTRTGWSAAILSFSAADPRVVGLPLMGVNSLMATGTPSNGRMAAPFLSRRADASALSMASSS